MTKTSSEKGWCTAGLLITPEDTWSCSACEENVSKDDQSTKGGWFDYDNDGKLGFIHVDCYTGIHKLNKKTNLNNQPF